MRKLQNNFTTPEQSKRLLELDMPADSADMYYCRMRTKEFGPPCLIGCDATYTSISTPPCGFIFAPCWSAGRLIEIYETCCNDRFGRWKTDIPVVDDVVNRLIRIHDGDFSKIDFSKLED